MQPSGLEQQGWSRHVLGGLSFLPPSLPCALREAAALCQGGGSWELVLVVSAGFEQSLAKPSPRLILICALRGDETPTAQGEEVPARPGWNSQPTRSLLDPDPASQAVTIPLCQGVNTPTTSCIKI